MKAARLVVLVIALGAGGVAALLAGRSKAPDVKPVAAVKPDTVEVLVAKSDIGLGQPVTPGEMQWQPWPASAATGNFIRKSDRPDALQKLSGEIARAPFVAGEPIREAKLVDAHGSGYMAAILPPGMRAVSTQISPETGAGGFILPNDRVDVILSKRDADKTGGSDGQSSETILTNVRVLAIDQNIAEKNGQRVVVGKTATLELSPSQAETLTMGQRLGTLALSLRSIADASATDKPDTDTKTKSRGTVNVIRFGVGSTVTTR
ncbi:MAG TPA: Flp pilus assembly protein CpaB [Pseudolabrys sp.]|jgi:pilus assembly protein CpaB|uniref:Flp pilus assembly protein CpaB n=1 Tax=Pseudolabrys sp. TaxID=1960880 RepID=UPI002DDD8B5D|nr:Flp pilus assembly protein CpaB [Pseudolabrys sp.]HEV2627139.1 Flp pilus assembly protein CpaB [Pseudolabrys sp.]